MLPRVYSEGSLQALEIRGWGLGVVSKFEVLKR